MENKIVDTNFKERAHINIVFSNKSSYSLQLDSEQYKHLISMSLQTPSVLTQEESSHNDMDPFVQDQNIPLSRWQGKYHGTDILFQIEEVLTTALGEAQIATIKEVKFTKQLNGQTKYKLYATTEKEERQHSAKAVIETKTNQTITIYIYNSSEEQQNIAPSNTFVKSLIAEPQLDGQNRLQLKALAPEEQEKFNKYAEIKPISMHVSTAIDAVITACQMLAIKGDENLTNNSPTGARLANIELGEKYEEITHGATLTISPQAKDPRSLTRVDFNIKTLSGAKILTGEFYWHDATPTNTNF